MAVKAEPRGPLRNLGRHTLIYGSGYVATAAVSLILTPIYTHSFTPSQFGLLALMLVLYGIGQRIYDLGFTNSVARFFFDADRESELREMRVTSLAFLAAYGGSLTALLWLFAGDWSNVLTGTTGHADLVRVVSISLLAETLLIVPLTLIRMKERSSLFLLITVVRLVSSLGLAVLFVVVLDWGVRGALLANAVPAAGILVVLLASHPDDLRGHASWGLLKQMLAFGLPFFPVLLCGWVIDASDRYLLEVFRTRDEVGFYSLAYRLAQVMQLGVMAFSMGWAPLRYQIFEQPDAQFVYRRITTVYVIAASIPAVAIAVFAPAIVDVVAPPSYAPAADVVPLLVLAYWLQGIYFMVVTGMGVMKRTTPMAWIAAVGAIVNVGVNLVAIPAFGMKGAAATTVLAYLVLVAGNWWASQRVYPIPYDWRRIAQVAGIGIVVSAAVTIFAPSDLAGETLCGLIAWLSFVVLLITTGAIERGDVRMLRDTARGWLGR